MSGKHHHDRFSGIKVHSNQIGSARRDTRLARRGLAFAALIDGWLLSLVFQTVILSPFEFEDSFPALLHLPHIGIFLLAFVAVSHFTNSHAILKWLLAVAMIACLLDVVALVLRIIMYFQSRRLIHLSTTNDPLVNHRSTIQMSYTLLALALLISSAILSLNIDTMRTTMQPIVSVESGEIENDMLQLQSEL